MSALCFVSRHAPTPDQARLAERMGFSEVRQVDRTLTQNAADEVSHLGVEPGSPIAVVAPLYVGLALVRAGYQVLEFVNDPEARRSGDFVCVGAYLHTLTESRFHPAPAGAT